MGGDLAHFLASVGLLSALRQNGLEVGKDFELRCCGFSAIPAVLWLSLGERAYGVLTKIWDEASQLFPNATKITAEHFSKRISNLLKLRQRLDGTLPKKLQEFCDKWLPDAELNAQAPVKVYSFNLIQGKEEMLTGRVRDIILKAVVYPIDFSPVDGYISLGWVFTFPAGDVIIYDEWNCALTPSRAVDYFTLSYCVRRNESARARASGARHVRVVRFSPSDRFPALASVFYRIGEEIGRIISLGGI